jgi:hypothetical protein
VRDRPQLTCSLYFTRRVLDRMQPAPPPRRPARRTRCRPPRRRRRRRRRAGGPIRVRRPGTAPAVQRAAPRLGANLSPRPARARPAHDPRARGRPGGLGYHGSCGAAAATPAVGNAGGPPTRRDGSCRSCSLRPATDAGPAVAVGPAEACRAPVLTTHLLTHTRLNTFSLTQTDDGNLMYSM